MVNAGDEGLVEDVEGAPAVSASVSISRAS